MISEGKKRELYFSHNLDEDKKKKSLRSERLYFSQNLGEDQKNRKDLHGLNLELLYSSQNLGEHPPKKKSSRAAELLQRNEILLQLAIGWRHFLPNHLGGKKYLGGGQSKAFRNKMHEILLKMTFN